METINYPVIIIEIPHQRKPSSWVAHNAGDIVDAAYVMADRDDSELSCDFRDLEKPAVADALQYLGHDLNGLMVYEQADIKSGLHRHRMHGQPTVEVLADREAEALGWVDSDELDEQD